MLFQSGNANGYRFSNPIINQYMLTIYELLHISYFLCRADTIQFFKSSKTLRALCTKQMWKMKALVKYCFNLDLLSMNATNKQKYNWLENSLSFYNIRANMGFKSVFNNVHYWLWRLKYIDKSKDGAKRLLELNKSKINYSYRECIHCTYCTLLNI